MNKKKKDERRTKKGRLRTEDFDIEEGREKEEAREDGEEKKKEA